MKLKSDFIVKDFLKLSKAEQNNIINDDITVYEKYDGVKISVVYTPGISDNFMDSIIVSYKGFRIFPFEKIEGGDKRNSHGYIQFSYIWKSIQELEHVLSNKCDDTMTEFLFEFTMKKPSIVTEYKDYHNLIYIAQRPIFRCETTGGRVSILTDEKFFVNNTFPICYRPKLLFSGKVFSLKSFINMSFHTESEFGGLAEGVIIRTKDFEYYKIVDPEKRKKSYRKEKTAKYFFQNEDHQKLYLDFIKEEAENVLDMFNRGTTEDLLKKYFNHIYSKKWKWLFHTEPYDLNVKVNVNIQDDIYMKVRQLLLRKPTSNDDVPFIPEEKNKFRLKLVILRGLPGSGKTTYAYRNYPNLHCHEADNFFIDLFGNYKFDSKFSSNAHALCYNNVIKDLYHGNSCVVANTFMTWKEIHPYLEFCVDNGIECVIIELNGEYESIHGIPDDVIQKMKERWVSTHLINLMFGILKKTRGNNAH